MASTSSGYIGPPTRAHQPQTTQTDAYLNKAQFGRLTEVVNSKWEVICQIVVKIPPHEEKLLRKYKKVEWEGTGFLIGGNFVVTNHHVLPSRKVAKYAEAYFFQVFSQDENKVKTLVKIVRIAFDPDRYFFASPHKEIQLSQFPNIPPRPLPADQEHLDFAIVPLKQGKEEDLYLHSIQKHVFSIFNPVGREHKPGDFVHIIHHPGVFDSTTLVQGDAKWSSGVLRNICKYFVHYSRMATGGSSGAALMGKEGDLIALNYQTVLVCREGCQSTVPSSSQEVSQEQTLCGCGPKDIVLSSDSGCCSGVMMDRIVDYLSSELNGVKQRDVIEGLILEDRARYPKYLSEQLIEYYRHERTSVGSNLMNIIDSLDNFCLEGVYPTLKPSDSSFTDQFKEGKQDQPRVILASELFKHEALANNPRTRVMVVGDAGLGKTGLCEEIAIHGSELCPQFSTVFFIRLRNLNKKNYPSCQVKGDKRRDNHPLRTKDYTVYEILAQETGFIAEEFEEILREEWFRKNVLIVLDGFDELPPEAQGGTGPLKNIFRGMLQTFDHVLVTSRRKIRGSGPFGAAINDFCQFEIVGFDNPSINLYIRKFYDELHRLGRVSSEVAETKITRLRQELEGRPDLYSLLQVPIILTLACSLFSQNSDIFDSSQTFSLTKFYALSVDWFYRWSLLRPTQSVGLSSSIILEESEPSLITPKMKEISEVLQLSAWESKKGGTIGQSISHYRRGKSFIDADLKDIGIVKFEGSEWEFIHSTFQDYFAATYLTNLYLDGRSDEAKQHLIQIKFDPNYTLTLRMTAGYLSHKRNRLVLQAFFDNLFDEPHDLARGYELSLIAACFEECENPEAIHQYSSFVTGCVMYIDTAILLPMVFDLLNRNVKLLHHKDIVNVIVLKLNHPSLLNGMVEMMNLLTLNRQVLPENVIAILLEIVLNSTLDVVIRLSVVKVLVEIAKRGGTFSEKVIEALKLMVEDSDVDIYDEKIIAKVLITMAKRRATMSLDLIQPLESGATELNLNRNIRNRSVDALGKIDQERESIIEENPLQQMFVRHTFRMSSRRATVTEFKHTAIGGGVYSQKAMQDLAKVFENSLDDESVKNIAAEGLRQVVERRKELSQEALQLLVKIVENLKLDTDDRELVAKKLGEIGTKVLSSLVREIVSCQLVFRVCSLSYKAFFIIDGKIYISDNRDQSEPVDIPSGFDVNMLELSNRFVDSPKTGSSYSPSPSSSSVLS